MILDRFFLRAKEVELRRGWHFVKRLQFHAKGRQEPPDVGPLRGTRVIQVPELTERIMHVLDNYRVWVLTHLPHCVE